VPSKFLGAVQALNTPNNLSLVLHVEAHSVVADGDDRLSVFLL